MKSNKQRKIKNTPSPEEVKNLIIGKMRELQLWDDRLLNEIPSCWDSFNNFIIFSSKYFKDDQWIRTGDCLWKHVSELFSGKSIALQDKIKNDGYRSPNVRVLYGLSQWVNCLDNGIWYTWNLEFTMFCTGNVSERHRIANFNCKEEIVVDMFAGIGYFTLPYLVHAKSKHVFACEWNPKSVEALRINLVKNKVSEKCTVLEGDVVEKGPRQIANRINLGLIPSCEKYWQTAAEILNPTGGILHVHENVTSFSHTANMLSQCEKCLSLLKTLPIDHEHRNSVEALAEFSIISMGKEAVQINLVRNKENTLKWKKIEWCVWSIHVCHSFCELLTSLTNTIWTVKPIFLHRVKGYAPHIDHLVLDIHCKNSMKTLSQELPPSDQ